MRPLLWGVYATPRVHHTSRRRGGNVAARSKCAAGGPDAAYRRAYGVGGKRSRGKGSAFRVHAGLSELGWTNGSNLRVEVRWGGGDVNQILTFAKELVGPQPDL